MVMECGKELPSFVWISSLAYSNLYLPSVYNNPLKDLVLL